MFSFHEEIFWKITVLFTASNEITIYEKRKNKPFHISREKKISPFTNHENTLYHPALAKGLKVPIRSFICFYIEFQWSNLQISKKPLILTSPELS